MYFTKTTKSQWVSYRFPIGFPLTNPSPEALAERAPQGGAAPRVDHPGGAVSEASLGCLKRPEDFEGGVLDRWW